MVETANKYYPNQQRKVNNVSSGIFNAFLGLGEVIGPLFGASMCEKISFRKTSDIVALICVAYALVFFLFGFYDPNVQPQVAENNLVLYNEKKRERSSSSEKRKKI